MSNREENDYDIYNKERSHGYGENSQNTGA